MSEAAQPDGLEDIRYRGACPCQQVTVTVSGVPLERDPEGVPCDVFPCEGCGRRITLERVTPYGWTVPPDDDPAAPAAPLWAEYGKAPTAGQGGP